MVGKLQVAPWLPPNHWIAIKQPAAVIASSLLGARLDLPRAQLLQKAQMALLGSGAAKFHVNPTKSARKPIGKWENHGKSIGKW